MTKKRKRLLVLFLIGCLYFSGIGAILYPIVSNVMSLQQSLQAITDYRQAVLEMPEEEIDKRVELAKEYNREIFLGNYENGLERCLCDAKGQMCYLEIPSIDVYLPVYYGTSEEVLKKGCGCLENTSLPVGGMNTHSVISGHTGLPTAEMLTKLDQVKENDVFYIHVLGEVLAYRVDQIEAVTPNKVELLTIKPEKDYLTLLTCTPYGINDKRLLVRGERIAYLQETASSGEAVPQKTAEDRSTEGLQEEITRQWWVIVGVVLGSVLLFALALVWLLHSIRNLSPEEQDGISEKTD